MNFTPKILQDFRKDLEAATKALEAKYQVTIKGGNIKYGATKFSMNLEVTTTQVNVEKEDFVRYAPLYGFKDTDYGREFTLNGRKFKLVGFNPRRPKFACRIASMDGGKDASTTLEAVQRAFK